MMWLHLSMPEEHSVWRSKGWRWQAFRLQSSGRVTIDTRMLYIYYFLAFGFKWQLGDSDVLFIKNVTPRLPSPASPALAAFNKQPAHWLCLEFSHCFFFLHYSLGFILHLFSPKKQFTQLPFFFKFGFSNGVWHQAYLYGPLSFGEGQGSFTIPLHLGFFLHLVHGSHNGSMLRCPPSLLLCIVYIQP